MQTWNETTAKIGTDWRRNVRDAWVLDFARNCVGYATILIPGYLLIRYYQKRRESLEFAPFSLYNKLITLLVFGWKNADLDSKPSSDIQPKFIDRIRALNYGRQILFGFCFFGLLFSHLVWGFYQEKMMTRDYFSYDTSTNNAPKRERFRDSQFIVFLNRIAALILSISYLSITYFVQKREHRSSSFEHTAPFYKYSYASLSNILSSWCQYEALKYVTFPTQVVGKASKIIPTMLVGRILHRRSYAWHQYAIGAFISAGVSMFLLSRSDEKSIKTPLADTTTISGLVLICGYLIFDSFTSNWQSSLFQEYGLGEMRMMCGVNFFSSLFTLIPLLEQGNFLKSTRFMFRHRDFCFDCVTTSLCSAIGQLFIFFTISEFGAVALAVIMTIRQAFAILLSCLYYGHRVSELGVFGLCVVFAALLAGQYLNKKLGGGGRRGN